MATSSLLTASAKRGDITRLLKELKDAFDTSTGHTHDGTDSASVGAGGTLDSCYDYGGAGSGKAVTVDSGAIALTNNAANNNGILAITKNPTGAQSGDALSITVGAQSTGTAITIANSGSGNDITGSGSTWSIAKTGALTVVTCSTGAVTLTEGAAPAGTLCYIVRDNDGDTYVNAITGKVVELRVAGTAVITAAGAAITLAQAVTVSTGGIAVTGVSSITGAVTITGATGITGNLTVTGNLSVSGAYSFSGQLTASAGIDLNGTELVLDADADTSITADTDDQVDIKINGTDYVSITVTKLDINALELVLDADANTSITADTDNRIDFKLGGTDELRYSTGAFAFQVATTISTGATTLTLDPTTDVVVANGKGLIVGNAAQVTTASAGEFQVLGTAAADSTAILGCWKADTTGPELALVKSRNATIGTATIVTAGDTLGSIVAYADDGADFATPAASIVFSHDNQAINGGGAPAPAANDMAGKIVFSTTADGANTVSEAMRIDQEHNVRIADGNGLIVGSVSVTITTAAAAEVQVLGTAAADSTIAIGQWAAAATGPELALLKSRNATIGSSTIVVDDDVLGSVVFYADDGTDFATPGASIHAKVHGTPGANDMPTALIFSTTPDATNAVVERMRLGPAGQMTIGGPTTDTENANMTIGITIEQGAADDQVLCFKSSDVATVLTTAVTNSVETDDFATFSKFAATTGGLLIQALGENAAVTSNLVIESYGGQAETTTSTAGRALIEIYASQHDGANALANVTDHGNVFGIRCRTGAADVTALLVNEDSQLWVGGAGVFVGTLTVGGTIYGSTAANGDLILASTTNATEGCISIPNGTAGLILGGVEAVAWAADNFIFMLDATVAPAGASGASGAGLYSAGGELYSIDKSGNTTQQTPHDEDGYWYENTLNTTRGNKVVRIHVERMLRAISEKYPGEFDQFIEELPAAKFFERAGKK
ncbi:MAG: hypothetical protein PHQ43_00140 [Dehalococcoidales bacterium]|nr:hypothetical protein [Dehalococcoidales bacterium]